MTCLGLDHDLRFLVAATAVCFVGAVTVFRIRSRMQGVRGAAWHVWVFLAASAVGSGVWSAHMLAMLAGDPSMHMGYDPMGALSALMVAVLGAHLSFVMAWSSRERLRTAMGGVLFAFTVAAMHYIGLAAQRLDATLTWEPILVWVSTASGALLAAAAVTVADRADRLVRQVAAAVLLTASVLSLHFISMGAASIHFDPSLELPDGLLDRTAMLFIACLIPGLMISIGLGAAYLDDMASQRAQARAQRLADATREGIALLTPDRRISDCNGAFCSLSGLTVEEVRGRELWDLMEAPGGESRLGERQDAFMLAADGERIPVAVKLSCAAELGEDGGPGLIAAVTDLREQRAAEARIRFLNEHDTVTGLPNRTALVGRMEAARERVAASDGGEMLSLIDVRVSNSRAVNAQHGHAAGDALLAKIGERLKRLAGGAESTARLSGNAFAFFLVTPADAADDAQITLFFTQAMKVLRRPFVWNAQVIEPQIRLGVASIPHDCHTVADLITHADSALQSPEEEGRDGVFFFRRELHEAQKAQRELAHDLRRAIAEDELTVYYQPQARSEDGSLCGFEALVRWVHPERGFLPPDSFISVAESSGLIGQLGEWVLRRACLDAMSWPKPVPVAVNLSPLQVGEPGLPTRVHEILLETGLPPSRLELEVTESALFRDYQRALDTLRRLKALGIKIAMDDFGTGFSSLSTLQSFPFDKIKIDKSFVQGVGALERSTVIVKAVLGIGRGLAIPVVAEGVETEEQMTFLRNEMCYSIQGYLLGKPGPVELHAHLFATAPEGRPRRRTAA